jgi:hypothetical protein
MTKSIVAFGARPDDAEIGVGSHPVKYMRTFNLGSDKFVFSVAMMIRSVDGPKITTDTLSTIRTFHRSFETKILSSWPYKNSKVSSRMARRVLVKYHVRVDERRGFCIYIRLDCSLIHSINISS